MKVTIINKTKDTFFKQYYDDIQNILQVTLKHLNISKSYEVALILVSEKRIHEINKTFRNIDRATDVISFAMLEGEDFQIDSEDLGDIYINIRAVYEQAVAYGHSIRREFCFLFTHGLLHCLGYDHMDVKGEKEMFTLQEIILEKVLR